MTGMLMPAKWIAAAAIAMFAIVAPQEAGKGRGLEAGPPAPPPIKLSVSSLTPEASIPINGDRQIVATADAVWVSDRTAGTLTRIDPKTNATDAPVAIGKAPCFQPMPAFGSVWTTLCGPAGLARLDPKATDKPPVVISVSIKAGGPIATGASSIWIVSDASGTLSRIDPDTNAVVAEIPIPAGSAAMAFVGDSVWLVSTPKNSVTRINGATHVAIETIKVPGGPGAIAGSADAIWVHSGDGTVSRIDPKTNKVAATVKTGVTAAGALAVGEGSVWLSAPGFPLTRIDPATNTMAQQFTGAGGGALAIGHKAIWMAATPGAIWRVDPRRVEATRR